MIIETSGEEATLKTKREMVLELFIKKYAELDELAETYDRMDTTIAFLTGTSKEDRVAALEDRHEQERKNRKGTRPIGRRDTNRGENGVSKNASKEQVLPALIQVVGDNPGIDAKEAIGLVEDKMREAGLGVRGVANQVKNYVKAAEFRVDDSGRVSLAREITVDQPRQRRVAGCT